MRIISTLGWKGRFFTYWRICVFALFPMWVVWLFGRAAWDKFILNIQPDLSWDMLIIVPLFFIICGGLLSSIAAIFPIFDLEN